jgi:hypothetical protein
MICSNEGPGMAGCWGKPVDVSPTSNAAGMNGEGGKRMIGLGGTWNSLQGKGVNGDQWLPDEAASCRHHHPPFQGPQLIDFSITCGVDQAS